MKNILGKKEDLELFNADGDIVYEFEVYSSGNCSERTYDCNSNMLTFKDSYGYWSEYTYDSDGRQLTMKNSDGYWSERTYDSDGRTLTFKDSNGTWSESTYDSDGNQLTYKDSYGTTRGFDKECEVKEYTMEELIEKLGHNFKIKK